MEREKSQDEEKKDIEAKLIEMEKQLDKDVIRNRHLWRYEFAGRAMQGLLSQTTRDHTGNVARTSVLYADALLEELEKK